MSFLENLIKASHKALEEKPEAYGLFHISFALLSILLIVAICYFARKSSERTFRTVLLSVGLALIASEIYKQLYYLYAAGGEGYDWYIFPFQLCSVPMYLSVVVGLMKRGRARNALCEYLVSIGFLGGIMAYAEPSGILTGYYFTLIHSCLWHAVLIFIALYILFTDNACHSLRGYTKAMAVTGGVVAFATLLNVIFRDKSDFNMCYISPFYNTPLAVFSSFDKALEGQLGYTAGRILSVCIYIVAIMLGGFIVYSASYFIKSRLKRWQGA